MYEKYEKVSDLYFVREDITASLLLRTLTDSDLSEMEVSSLFNF
jgi:hypothetical protein